MATSENTVLVSFNVQLRSKQIVSWTILPVDRTMTVAELCKSRFVGDFTDIKEVGENNNPFVNFDLKYWTACFLPWRFQRLLSYLEDTFKLEFMRKTLKLPLWKRQWTRKNQLSQFFWKIVREWHYHKGQAITINEIYVPNMVLLNKYYSPSKHYCVDCLPK